MSDPILPPETRLSLLARLSDAADEEAWNEFVEMYTPAIYRAALAVGLQDADAQDVVQQVLISVAGALAKRPHDPQQARFRTWLSVVSRNTTISLLRSRRPDRGSGDSGHHRSLQGMADENWESEELLLEQEYQKEVFRAVAREIESDFSPDTWQAFWLTTVEGQEITAVAQRLGKQVGSVYAARSRVMSRLRQRVADWMSEK